MNQWVVEEASASGGRCLTNGQIRIRLLTREQIDGMNLTNVKRLYRKCADQRPLIFGNGSEEAIRAIDFMVSTTKARRHALEMLKP